MREHRVEKEPVQVEKEPFTIGSGHEVITSTKRVKKNVLDEVEVEHRTRAENTWSLGP